MSEDNGQLAVKIRNRACMSRLPVFEFYLGFIIVIALSN